MKQVIKYFYRDNFFWIRIFGYGIGIKDVNKYPLTFSQRNGYYKHIKIGKWIVYALPK